MARRGSALARGSLLSELQVMEDECMQAEELLML